MPFHFVPLGVGDAFSAVYYSSSLALEAEGCWLLIDCPHPIRKILKEASANLPAPVDVQDITGIVLTHLHGDHCNGLEGLAFYSHYQLQRRATVLCHPDVARFLWDGHLAVAMAPLLTADGPPKEPRQFEDYIDLIEFQGQGKTSFGPFQIEWRKTIHQVPTTALRISACGRSLGYSSDTAFDPSLISWLGQADLVVHEMNLGAHTSYLDLKRLPLALRERMRLIHYPDAFDRGSSTIEPLHQGRRYSV
jgi:ribonuclease BN (tRNA processing enzyme)